MIDAYFLDVNNLNDDLLFKKYYDNTSNTRKNKIDRLEYREDKNLSLGASILIDFGLKKFGLNEYNMQYGELKCGKPYFFNKPSIFFNVSHSYDKVMVTFSDTEIGCDIERIKTIDLNIAKRFFCEKEYNYIISKNNQYEIENSFFKIWTVKESFAKLKGEGLSLKFNSFNLQFLDGIIKSTQNFDGDYYYFNEIDAFDGYKTAICSEMPISGINKKIIYI